MVGRGRAGSRRLHSQASRLEPKFVALGVRATLVGHPGLGRPGEEAGALRAAQPRARGWSDARVEAGPAQSGLLFGGPAPTLHGWPCAGRTVSLLAGGVILGVALWLRHDPQTTNLLYLELGDRPAPNTFYVGIYILIAVGAVMMFVGFLGCYGAIQESQCLLGTFFTCLVILFACEVAAGIWGFVNKDQIAKDVKQFYDQALQQAVVDDDANNAKAVVKTFHETLNCCGSSTLSALTTSILKNNLCPSGSTVISNFFKISTLLVAPSDLSGRQHAQHVPSPRPF
uniref:Tetraspanin n=1 Tax=Felis catus TaxID=9685 RepID=A0ABI7W5R1_FELCA